jgi:hypothetical protein
MKPGKRFKGTPGPNALVKHLPLILRALCNISRCGEILKARTRTWWRAISPGNPVKSRLQCAFWIGPSAGCAAKCAHLQRLNRGGRRFILPSSKIQSRPSTRNTPKGGVAWRPAPCRRHIRPTGLRTSTLPEIRRLRFSVWCIGATQTLLWKAWSRP